jgi:hypothetical protein
MLSVNTKKIILLFCSVFFILGTQSVFAQAGKKKERSNQKRSSAAGLFKKNKSAGHSDAFARSDRKGFFARLFGKTKGPWVYRTSRSYRHEAHGTRISFSRQWTKRKKLYFAILQKQNAYRAKHRVHGNKVFHKKKY